MPRRNGQHFADRIFNVFFFNENVWISIINSLIFVPEGPINNIPALVQILHFWNKLAWRRPSGLSTDAYVRYSAPINQLTQTDWNQYFRLIR